MRRPYAVLLLLTASLPLPLPAQQPFMVTDGTPIRVRLNRNLSSADAKTGDPVDFDVVEDIIVNGVVIIQRGSRVLATVTDAAKARMGKAGKLTVNVDYARSVLGEKIALRAVKENEGGDKAANRSVVGVAASVVTAPISMFVKGKDITIPKGTEVTAYVHGDIRLDEARFRTAPLNAVKAPEAAASVSPAPVAAPPVAGPQTTPTTQTAADPPPQAAPAPPQRPSGITNADIVALRVAGFSDELILAKIKSSRCAFRMETSDMIELKKVGLSDRVIGAMMEKMQ